MILKDSERCLSVPVSCNIHRHINLPFFNLFHLTDVAIGVLEDFFFVTFSASVFRGEGLYCRQSAQE